MSLPKSTIAKMRTTRIGAIRQNSTIACERCRSCCGLAVEAAISVAANCHVRVGHDVDRVAEEPRHEARYEPEVHDEDDVHVGALEAVVGGRGRQVESGRVGVADEKRGPV